MTGRLSMSLALVALLAVAGTHAARPVDISDVADTIEPRVTDQLSASDRALLDMHPSYPPPPPPLAPLEETQDGSRPSLVQTVEISFANSSAAQNFTTSIGTVRLPKGATYDQNMLTANELFAYEYLQTALDASTAEDGSLSFTSDGNTVMLNLRLAYEAGTNIAVIEEAESQNIANNLFEDVEGDDTRPNPGNRKLLEVKRSVYEEAAGVSGATLPYEGFVSAATNVNSFSVEEGALGLRASLFMGFAVALATFLLA